MVFDEKNVTLGDGTGVLLRPPGRHDAGAMLEYLDAVRRETDCILYSPEDAMPTLEEESAFVTRWRDSESALAISGWINDELVALCSVEGSRFFRHRHRREIGISIRARWCGMGLGEILMGALIDHAKSNGALLLELSVFAHNARAIALYRKCGFTETGRIMRSIQYANGRFADTLTMTRWIGD